MAIHSIARSDNAAGIHGKLLQVTKSVTRIPKAGYNTYHKYHYATEADLAESIRSLLAEAKLALWISVSDWRREGQLTQVALNFSLTDVESGESLQSTFWGEGQDSGDKGFYKAYTGAVKYFLMKTFLIPTGDDPEADLTTNRTPQTQPLAAHAHPPLTVVGRDSHQAEGSTEQQAKAIHAIAKAKNLDLNPILADQYNAKGTRDLSKAQASELITTLQGL